MHLHGVFPNALTAPKNPATLWRGADLLKGADALSGRGRRAGRGWLGGAGERCGPVDTGEIDIGADNGRAQHDAAWVQRQLAAQGVEVSDAA